MPTADELTVRQIMQADPIRVGPRVTIQDVLRLMNDLRVGSVLVAAGDELVGIFTERDFLRQAATAAPGWRSAPVGEWMTRDPHTIGPDDDWERAMAMLEEHRVRHLPVVEGGRIVGIVSARHLIAFRQDHLNGLIEQRTRELRSANDQLIARDADTVANMRIAGRVLERIVLPHQRPEWPEFEVGVHFEPLDQLGGDYYDFADLGTDHVGLLVADASGHSIPASLVAVMARTAFAEVAKATLHPGQVLAAMNERLQGLSDERFVTAFYGVLHRATRRLTFANAGHPPVLRYVRRTGQVDRLSARGFLLGIIPGEVYKESHVTLEVGDRVVLYTDGVIEARDELGDTFGIDRLADFVREHGEMPPVKLSAAITERIDQFRAGTAATDDVTLVVVGVGDSAAPCRLTRADF